MSQSSYYSVNFAENQLKLSILSTFNSSCGLGVRVNRKLWVRTPVKAIVDVSKSIQP